VTFQSGVLIESYQRGGVGDEGFQHDISIGFHSIYFGSSYSIKKFFTQVWLLENQNSSYGVVLLIVVMDFNFYS
jgi:hypothetical protein